MALTPCQSCGMPLHRDPQGGGTNADGSKSDEYCSYCYGDGKFFIETDDVKDFQRQVVDNMVENGWWRPWAWLMTRGVPKLRRWRAL